MATKAQPEDRQATEEVSATLACKPAQDHEADNIANATATASSLEATEAQRRLEHHHRSGPRMTPIEENVFDAIGDCCIRDNVDPFILAEELERPFDYVIRLLVGRVQPSKEDVRRLSVLLNLPLNELEEALLPLKYSLYTPYLWGRYQAPLEPLEVEAPQAASRTCHRLPSMLRW